MKQFVEIEYRELEPKREYNELIEKVIQKCFEVEKLENTNLYVSIILTTPAVIQKLNCQYRNIDKPTDVLSFPMFEKEEIPNLYVGANSVSVQEVLGDIVISVEKVHEQAVEYEHSFERELSYMLVHGFYHLMGEDHIEEEDKKHMREKEEKVLGRIENN